MSLKSIYLFVFLLLGSFFQSFAQNGTIVGLMGNQLVAIDAETAQMRLFLRLDWPIERPLKSLVFVSQERTFFTIAEADTSPKLIRIDGRGKTIEIGEIILPGEEIINCKSFSFDAEQQKAFVSASIKEDGRFAETLLEIDLQTARCTKVAQLRGANPGNDFEAISIYKEVIYVMDAEEGLQTTYVFSFPVSHLSGELRAGSMLNLPFHAIEDMLATSYILYFSDRTDGQLYCYNIRSQQLKTLGVLKGEGLPANIPLTGITLTPAPRA